MYNNSFQIFNGNSTDHTKISLNSRGLETSFSGEKVEVSFLINYLIFTSIDNKGRIALEINNVIVYSV